MTTFGLVCSMLAISISYISIMYNRTSVNQINYEEKLNKPKVPVADQSKTPKNKLKDEFDKKLQQELYLNLQKIVKDAVDVLKNDEIKCNQIALTFTYDDWPERLRYTAGLIPFRHVIVKNIARNYNCGMRRLLSVKRLDMFIDEDSVVMYDMIKTYKQVLKELEQKGYKISFNGNEKLTEDMILVIKRKD